VLERRRRIDRATFAVVMETYVHGVSSREVDDSVAALLLGQWANRLPRRGQLSFRAAKVDQEESPDPSCGAGAQWTVSTKCLPRRGIARAGAV
jgi:hypothetical protein